jgi:hypothetical protein
MRKLLGFLLVSVFLLASSNAFAFNSENWYWNLNNVAAGESSIADDYFVGNQVGSGSAPLGYMTDGITELMSEMNYYADTWSSVNYGQITDSGLGYLTGLNDADNSSPSDTEGLNSFYNITFAWDNLQGQVDSVNGTEVSASYDSGTINFYLDLNGFSGADSSSYSDGILLFSVVITGGGYTLDLATGNGDYSMEGYLTNIYEDFWYLDGETEDITESFEYTMNWTVAFSHGDNEGASITYTDPGGDPNIYVVSATHDSSLAIGIVPEPATFTLFGLCLIGFAGVARKRSRV